MSKIREQFESPPPPGEPLVTEPTGDLRAYVIFTQLRTGGPYIYAGWLEAIDDGMAMAFAKEHYGQDQECVNIQAIRREHLTSSDGLYPSPSPSGRGVRPALRSATQAREAEGEGVAATQRGLEAPSPLPSPRGRGSWHIYTQKRAGDLWVSAETVDAATPQAAIDAARESIKQATSAHAIWVVADEHVISTHGDLIWRHTDQSYRLARGYGREVRAKWTAFRDEKQLAEYEKDDLQEAF